MTCGTATFEQTASKHGVDALAGGRSRSETIVKKIGGDTICVAEYHYRQLHKLD